MRYASTYDKTGTPVVAELQGDVLVPLAGLTELGAQTTAQALTAAGRRTADAFPASEATLRPVIPNPAKVFCVGLNYQAHIAETGRNDSDYPVLFPKFASSLTGPFSMIDLPLESEQIDYEGELAVVIGQPGRRISEADASDHVLGYTVANDVSMRDYQYKTHQWMQGKASRRTSWTSPRSGSPPSSTARRSRTRPLSC
jgi:acylpyruvate hydrolase